MIPAQLYSAAIKTILRFPLTISSFVGVFIIAIYLDDSYEFWRNLDNTALEEILPFLVIGFFQMFAVELYSERKKVNSAYLAFPVIILLCLYFFYLQANIEELNNNHADQTPLLFLASVAIVIIALFVGKRSYLDSFWQYNRKLATRFIFAIFTSVVLYEVLALFLQAVAIPMYLYLDFLHLYLPNIDENYFWTATSIAATIGALVFLSGIPVTNDKNTC